ncbi:DUF1834 family protein [Jeongeupia chitinilytica]|uniref:DUF1834 family protein n=1 Tax=Jeongeupia chitinilytica TaxID=1041641 RepID=A0ABQ3H098_9NEIS|nr:DUF1834 family protein [Jeongeupia chitinilytica]GHD63857.1 hypothetical protein GCM10007350_22150 [Jeongeupia chitinilytica]
MILTQIEDAVIARLRLGLGRMVKEVGCYGGELDEALPDAIRRFPAAWVTFGGVSKTEPTSTSRQKFKATGQFVVMVGERNVRNEAAGRRGGPSLGEVGSYPLVYAVRRLLSAQDLDLPIDPLMPGRVRTLYNTRLESQAFSVFACEFQTAWIEEALPRSHWPSPPAPGTPGAEADPDMVFVKHQGKTGQPDPDWLRTGLNYHLNPDDGKADAQDLLTGSNP